MKRIIWVLALTMCLINIGCQKYPAKIAVEAVTLNTTSILLTEGESTSVTATISPSNATNQKVLWKTSNSTVATIENGLVRAISAGKATVTATSEDGDKTATCEITVVSEGPTAVDLGLSVKWASCNVGASKPEEYGAYFQWAGLKDVTDTSIYLDDSYCPYHTSSDYDTGWTKYIPSDKPSYWSGSGSPDNKTVLDPEDDIARIKFGGKWRIPTEAELQELLDNCNSEWTTLNGVKGRKFTSKKNDTSIFLPAAGCRYFYFLVNVGSLGYYWSSSLSMGPPVMAYNMEFFPSGLFTTNYSRYFGQSVRPVSE